MKTTPIISERGDDGAPYVHAYIPTTPSSGPARIVWESDYRKLMKLVRDVMKAAKGAKRK